MTLTEIALNQIIVVFLIILVGIICYKVNLINKETNKKLSDILLLLVNPMVIFVSYQRDFSSDLLKGLLISFILAIITHLFGVITAQILLRGKNNPDVAIERFSTIYSNCGFMGIPLVNGIFGGEGVFYITAYITIFNLFTWTHGVIIMVGKQDVKSMLKTLLSPTLIAIFIGFIFFVAQIRIPTIAYESFNYIGSMNTPLAMIIAGVTIAQTDIRKVFFKGRIYLVSFLKLLFIPAALALIYSRFSISESVLITAVLAAACPTGATGTLFALRYNKNALYASEIFGMTTMLSLATIPIIMMLLGFIS